MTGAIRVLHLAAHLGGGVGKAHAAIRAVDPRAADHAYILLEPARDRRYADAIIATGARVIEAPAKEALLALLAEADIVQIEFWNHPRLYEALARLPLPQGRYLFWSHISGLAPPLIAEALTEAADIFVYTSACSLVRPAKGDLRVIGSGFGLDHPPKRRSRRGALRGGYLGTVDFVKMSPDFFSIVDAVEGPDFEIAVYGAFDPEGGPARAHAAMRHPERVVMMGQTDDPAEALAGLDFFFYPLDREHFGTAENALVEAMSAGLTPLVLDNPAERAIVTDGVTGLVAGSVEQCVGALTRLLAEPRLREELGDAAALEAARRFRPEVSRNAFAVAYADLMARPRHLPDFAAVLGAGPLDWFLGSFPKGATIAEGKPSKGSLRHFLDCFPKDEALNRRAGAADEADGREK
ncbi:glycosyltransferase [Rhizobium sp. C4]|uniref:glycosyltransferase n=1 Tax=Rhizobium sp. C4 TaxID=1349800 RepID=UPI001E465EB1|nr:glycosyltransferase [Rhizobium sp. C4]MCD2174635.1 glycosyltransferase [Rhizobium sp. C4]